MILHACSLSLLRGSVLDIDMLKFASYDHPRSNFQARMIAPRVGFQLYHAIRFYEYDAYEYLSH